MNARIFSPQQRSQVEELGQSENWERATFGEVWTDGVSTDLRRRWIKLLGENALKVNFWRLG